MGGLVGISILFCLFQCREGLCKDEEKENEGGITISKRNDQHNPHPYYIKIVDECSMNNVQKSNPHTSQRRKSCYVYLANVNV